MKYNNRKEVMTYFLSHSLEETSKYFNLSKSQLKSLFTVAYRDPSLKMIRKDKRRKDKFTTEELQTMLRWSGLLSRQEIAKKINRGSERVIKEKLANLGIASRNINGINYGQFLSAFGKEPLRLIKSSAGPKNNFYFKIILWQDVVSMIENGYIKVSEIFKRVAYSMGLFQQWIWDTNNIFDAIKEEK